MPVIVTMPDGSEQEFPDIASARAYKKKILADPNVGGALKFTGDPEEAKKFLDIQGKGQDLRKGELEVQKMERELEAPSTKEDLTRAINTYEDTLRELPVAKRGPFAIAQGNWHKAKGWLGWSPAAADLEGQRQILVRKILKGTGDTRPSDKDIPGLLEKIPDVTNPLETREQRFQTMRGMLDIPSRDTAWNVMRRHAIQAPQGDAGDIR